MRIKWRANHENVVLFQDDSIYETPVSNKQRTTAHLNANIQQINLRIHRGHTQLLPTATELHIINTVPRLKPPHHLIRLFLTPSPLSHRRIEQNHFAVLPCTRHNLPKLSARLRDPHHGRSTINLLLLLAHSCSVKLEIALALVTSNTFTLRSRLHLPHKTRSLPREKLTSHRLRRQYLHHFPLMAAILEHRARFLIVPELFVEFQKSGLL